MNCTDLLSHLSDYFDERLSPRLLEEIRTYSAAQGFDLVLGEGVFYSKTQLDITAQVLELLKTKPSTVPNAPKPAAAPAKPPATK